MNAKKILVGALAGALLFFVAHFAFAAGLADVQTPPADVLKKANDFAARIGMLDFDFFTETNKEGDALRYGDLILPHEGTVKYLAWGPWHSDPNWDGGGATKKDRNNIDRARYVGYGYYGEQVSNVFFPPDRSGDWKPLSGAGIVEKPWNDSAVIQAFPQFFGPMFGFDDKNDPDLIKSMQIGLDYSALSNEFAPPDPNSDLYLNPQKYLHVYLPPSEGSWGMGVMFNRDPDGSLWYRSVPLTDLARAKINPDDAISLDPTERTGKPGDPATFNLKVNWKEIKPLQEIAADYGFDFGFLVQVSHHVNGSPNAAAFTLDGVQSQDAGNSWAQVDYTTLDDTSKTGSVTVHVQNAPSEVVAQIVPYVKDRESGSVFLWNDTYLYKQARVKVTPNNLLNLVAVSIDTGAPGEAEPDTAYTASVAFKNDSGQALTGVPVGGFNREYRAVLKDANGNDVQYADFAPGEVKGYYFTYHTPDAGVTRISGVIDTDPLEQKYQESTYADNKVFADVVVREVDNSSQGDLRLKLQAYLKAGEDIYGNWLSSIARDPYTAKWTDDVDATLAVKKPVPPRGTLDWWEITRAKITYPEQNPDFMFGNPVHPVSTVSKAMNVPGQGDADTESLEATAAFEENWALDGYGSGTEAAGIYNMMTGEVMSATPKPYPISADFTVTYQYHYTVCDGDPPSCRVVTEVRSYNDTAEHDLLVNGSGTVPYGS